MDGDEKDQEGEDDFVLGLGSQLLVGDDHDHEVENDEDDDEDEFDDETLDEAAKIRNLDLNDVDIHGRLSDRRQDLGYDVQANIGLQDDIERTRSRRQRQLTEKGRALKVAEGKKSFFKLQRKALEQQRSVNVEISKHCKSEAKIQLEICELMIQELSNLGCEIARIDPSDSSISLELDPVVKVLQENMLRIRENVGLLRDSSKDSHKPSSKHTRSSRRTRSSRSAAGSLMLKLAEAEAEMKEKKISQASRRAREHQEKQLLELKAEQEAELLRMRQEQQQKILQMEQQQKKTEEDEEISKSQVKFKVFQKYYEDQELGSDDPGSEDEGQDQEEYQKIRHEVKKEEKTVIKSTPLQRHRSKPLLREVREQPVEKREHGNLSMVSEAVSFAAVQEKYCDMIREQSAPAVEITKFSGKALDFRSFLTKFEVAVERKVSDEDGKLIRLLNLVEGTPAQELIEFCQWETDGYQKAKRILMKEYNDDYKISLAYEAEIQRWPSVKTAKEVRSYYHFLLKVGHSIKSEEFAVELNSQSNLRTLASKLPRYMQDSWNREATKLYEKQNRKPKFENFMKFLDMESLVANNPCFGRTAVEGYRGKEQEDKDKDRRGPGWDARNRGRGNEGRSFRNMSVKRGDPDQICEYCEMKNHKLDDCFKFREISVEDRVKFIQKSGLCFGCLKSTNHRAAECQQRAKCTICSKIHATCLHNEWSGDRRGDDKGKEQKGDDSRKERYDGSRQRFDGSGSRPESKNAATDLQSSDEKRVAATSLGTREGESENRSVAMSCVPVELMNPTTGKTLIVYCFLDSLSNTSFITSQVYDQLVGSSHESQIEVVKLSTLGESGEKSFHTVSGLRVRDVKRTVETKLPKLYKVDKLPVDGDDIMCGSELEDWPHLRHLVRDVPVYDDRIPVGLLIGNDAPRLLEPHDVSKPDPEFEKSPYAVRYLLGWSGAGPNRGRQQKRKAVNTKVEVVTETGANVIESRVLRTEGEDEIKSMLKTMYERDFVETDVRKPLRSKEDEKFMQLLESGTSLVDGRYFMPLPFRNAEDLRLPDNRSQAYGAALRLQRRLNGPKNEELKGKYIGFMNELLREGQASKVPVERTSTTTGFDNHCFLNYHDVKHPQKPEKFRVVFNASKEYEGQSLNSNLLQGPTTELMSNQIGVLMRFRSEIYAFTADIKGMFNQTRVVGEHRKFLRFYWWNNESLSGPPDEFEMNVHLFGATSSPGCSMYALRKTALDHSESFSEESVECVLRNFYVDDVLKSVADLDTAKKLTVELCDLLKKGGFELTKFESPQEEVLVSLPKEKLASKGSSVDFQDKTFIADPTVGALGLQWNIRNDSLEFRITIKDRPFTRRGLLASVSSIYDPLGLAAPFLLPARRLLQELTKSKYGWNDSLSSDIIEKWIKWRSDLSHLESIRLDRCVKPKDFGKVKEVQLHGFSDASELGYGASLYLRFENERGDVHVSLILGKSRVVPLTGETIPRSELVASLLVAELSSVIESELDYENVTKFLWTDSQIVLAYLANQTSRFKTFVANRVRKCLELSVLEDWHHVPSEQNPADHASRGLSARNVDVSHMWFQGPEFLWKLDSEWPCIGQNCIVSEDDPEIKKTTKVMVTVRDKTLVTDTDQEDRYRNEQVLRIVEKTSDWFCMKRRIACVILMLENFDCEEKASEITVEHLCKAEVKILSSVQQLSFEEEFKLILDGKNLSQTSSLAKLNVFVDPNSGLLRVGGRAEKADVEWDVKHPVVIPKFGPVTDAIIKDCHRAVQHGGRAATLNEIRARGYWILHANSKVKHAISKCVRCRSMRGKYGEQKMAPLPKDRVAYDAPPMSYCGVDVFGPFVVKNKRKEEKRYCALFTDLVYRGIHLEVLDNLESDSFICALRRFVARRGNIRLLRSDNGTNFRGAYNEIQRALQSMEPELRKFLLQNGADLEWKWNVPTASHHGGSWERQIASARRVLESVLSKHHGLMNDQSFRTLMTEVEAVVNCRPLTTETLSDPDGPLPLSPYNLLTQKTKVVLPPPGDFDDRAELYTRRQWRRTQHLANEIWTRYRKEYLSQLQSYSKWTKNRRNFKVDDLVLLKDDSLHRNHWPLGRIVEVYPDASSNVRSVKLRMARDDLKDKPKYFDRPITKLVLLLESSSVETKVDSETV